MSEYRYESAGVKATRSGAKATCSLVIDYPWVLSSPAYDKITISFNLSAYDANGASRESNGVNQKIALPNNGATATITANAEL